MSAGAPHSVVVRNRNSGYPAVIVVPARLDVPGGLDVPTVLSRSFGGPGESFESTPSLLNLRLACLSAASSGVTVMASSGNNGTANLLKEQVKKPTVIPLPKAGLGVRVGLGIPAGLGIIATGLARALATATRAWPT